MLLENQRFKIDVYLTKEQKKEIARRATKIGLSVSDYVKLKSLDLLKDKAA